MALSIQLVQTLWVELFLSLDFKGRKLQNVIKDNRKRVSSIIVFLGGGKGQGRAMTAREKHINANIGAVHNLCPPRTFINTEMASGPTPTRPSFHPLHGTRAFLGG